MMPHFAIAYSARFLPYANLLKIEKAFSIFALDASLYDSSLLFIKIII